ncbi:MAG: uroporphyrinogen decarboxylase [Magnetococcales bacterium]|nr:uroporphyrinogen decarboxylase [Magnetococcales bacterium]
MEPKHPFLRACLRLPVERTPIWIMRQAGRYLPEYRASRGEAGDFLSLCRNTPLATEVTMQPLRRFNLDAAILFSDILVVPEAMGVPLRFATGEGPILEPPIRSADDVKRLRRIEPEKDLDYVMNAVGSIREALDDKVPLIGFSGSPWTLATYMIEGGSSKTFPNIKGMLYDQPTLLDTILDRLVEAVADYLNAQIDHGAQAVQIFDTWGGALSPKAYRAFSLEPMRRIVEKLKPTGPDGQRVPVILFSKGCGGMLEHLVASGCDVVGLDWTINIGEARKRANGAVALQGNMDPAVLYASPDRIREEARTLLEAYGPHPGHIFNLGHGISPDMNPDHVAALVDAVHSESARLHGNGSS